MTRKPVVFAACLGLAACTGPAPAPPASPPAVPPAAMLAAPLSPPLSPPPAPLLAASTGNSAQGFESLGNGGVTLQSPSPAAQVAAGATPNITFNFVNADVSAVAQTIFGQLLNQNYTIDGGVQGTITLQTTRPLTRDQVIPALETSLQMANLALIHEADGYHIAPLANAPAAGAGNLSIAGGPQIPGFGYEIIPLQYANAAAVLSLIQPLAQSGVQLQVDEERNLLIVAGNTQQRAAIAANVAVFDVNTLAGMSYALVPLQNASATTVAKEVDDLINGGANPLTGLARLVVIGQLNAILVVSQQPDYITEIKGWIARFDQQASEDEPQLFVYRVQNGDAKDIAKQLNNLLGQSQTDDNSADSAAPEAPDDQSGQSSQSGNTGPAGAGGLSAAPASQDNTQPSQPATNTPGAGDTGDTGQSMGGGSDGTDDSADGEPPPRITADDTTNALLIYATADQYRTLQSAIVQLDVAPQQVMLEAVVAEVTLNNDLAYGVQYFFQSGRVSGYNTTGTVANAVAEAAPGFSAILAPGQNIQIVLNALSQLTHVDVISAPKLLVLNNQPASLQVGDEVPITTETAQSTIGNNSPLVSTVQYQDTGVILHVTPRINAGGLVTLDLTQEVSSVSPTTTSTLNSPTISDRKLSTIVAVEDGQTVVLGGMIQTKQTNDNNGIPYLSEIPVLGTLFSSRTNNSDRDELLVMITPHVVQSESALQSVSDELRSQMSEGEGP